MKKRKSITWVVTIADAIRKSKTAKTLWEKTSNK